MLVTGNQTSAIGNQTKFPEKRSAVRIPVDANIVFTRFVTRNDIQFRAKTFDYSTEGMAFGSTYPLRRGDGLFIRTEDPSHPGAGRGFCPSGGGECLRTTTLAEVKWCREMPGKSESNYRVGVKYTSPVIS